MFSWIFLDVIVWGFVCSICISYEKGWLAFWASTAAMFGAFLLGYNIPMMAWNNPMLVAQYAAIYIGIGAVWASFKFIWKLRKARSLYIKDKTKWLKGIGEFVTDESKGRTEEQWIKYCKSHTYEYQEIYAPTVSANKSRIMLWMTWWPFSVISFFFADLLSEVWDFVWQFVKGFLEGIRKTVLGEAAEDLD